MSRKLTFEEINKKIQEINPNLIVIAEKYDRTNQRIVCIKNIETGCEFWRRSAELNRKNFNYDIIRYNTNNVSNIIKKITNDEYELISECEKYNSIITVLHKKCNRSREYRASHFINDGNRCRFCSIENLRKPENIFDLELSKMSNNTIVRKTDYIGSKKDCLFKCLKCEKDFISKPESLLEQYKIFEEIHCPNCYTGFFGETFINQLLQEKNIIFKRQYSDKECKDIRPLRFDFAIFDQNLNLLGLIEFDGKQHRDPTSKYAGKQFETIIKHDNIKNTFCKNKNIPLLRSSTNSKNKLKKEVDDFLKLIVK